MTSFSSSSTAHPTGRLLCSACRLGIMGSRPLASVTRRVLIPPPPCRGPPRTPAHRPPTPGSCPSLCWSPRSLPGPWSCLGALRWTDGWERAQTRTSPPAGGREALDFTPPPLSLGAPWCLREEPGGPPRAGRPSLLKCVRILPLAKAEGSAIHCPPPAPQLHVH